MLRARMLRVPALARQLSSTASRPSPAAAPAPAALVRPPPARTYRRAVVGVDAAAAAPVRKARVPPLPLTPSPSPSLTRSTPATAAAAAAAPPTPEADDYDFPLPPTDDGPDYAHVHAQAYAQPKPAPAPTPTPSPPLSALPDSSYVPLPSTNLAMGGDAGPGVGAGYVAVGSGRLPGEVQASVDDWTTSFRGLSERPFDKDAADALLRPLDIDDVEIKPDGLLYLPEIKYRRTLNAAFGPGGWGMAPRGETHVGSRIVSREWGLVCLGRLVAIARGEQEFFDPSGIPTATEACKSNALMRCCKDLGIASELWDPRFIREFKAKHCVEAMVEHVTQKKKRKLWRKRDAKFDYPYKEVGPVR